MSDYADALRLTIIERRVAPFLIQHGTEEFNLQLAGIGLLQTGEVRNPAARPVLDKLLPALAEREWFGDEILTEWLSDALAERHQDKALPVDIEELSSVLEGEMPDELAFYLDLRTGEQVLVDDDDESEDLDRREHLLYIPQDYWHGESWRDRLRFTAWVEDEDLEQRLIDALEGKGAYRRFRRVLERYPDLTTRFWDLAHDRQRCRAVRWLNGQDIRLAVGGQLKAI